MAGTNVVYDGPRAGKSNVSHCPDVGGAAVCTLVFRANDNEVCGRPSDPESIIKVPDALDLLWGMAPSGSSYS